MSQPNPLGSLRKHWKLSDSELAHLLGYRFESAVSRAEKNDRPPTIKFALACEVVFGEGPSALFPTFFAEIEEEVMRRAAKLDAALRHDFSHEANVKRDLLTRMSARVGNHSRP